MNALDVKNAARGFGADLVGLAPVERFAALPPEHDPLKIFPQAKTMIVIGRRIPRGALRGAETGTALNGTYTDFGLYMLEDQYLAKATYDLAIWFEVRGFEAVPMFGYDADAASRQVTGMPVAEGKPAPNVYVDWKLAAHLCGLGEVGKNGLFITPEFGTLQRFAMLLSDKELECDEVKEFGFCKDCNACMEACPLKPGLCSRCHNGAVQTDFGRFNITDKIAAACGRACLDSLEKRGLLSRKFINPFRTRTPWKRDLLNREVK